MARFRERRTQVVVSLLLGLIVSAPAIAGRGGDQVVDWTRPDSIDPLKKGITEFLDADLRLYEGAAITAYNQKRYKEAARYYLLILRHNYNYAPALYNLACCYGLLGEAELAADTLVRAVKAGFRQFDHIMTDEDFRKVRENEYFQQKLRDIVGLRRLLGESIWIKTSKLVKCRVKLPDGYDPAKRYPVLIALHGNGGNADDFIGAYRLFDRREFIFATPEGAYPIERSPGAMLGEYSWAIRTADRELWKIADPMSIDHVREVASEIGRRYKVSEVYLMGFSQGAAYAYMTAIRHKDMFAGIIGIGGILPAHDSPVSVLTEGEIKAAKTLPVLIAHSRQDSAVTFERGLQAKKLLKGYGYDVTFVEYEGGHVLTSTVLNRVVKWMNKD